MKKNYASLFITFLFLSLSVSAQKAFFGGFGELDVYNPVAHTVTNSICCDNYVYLTLSNDSTMLYTSNFNSMIHYINPVTETVVDSMDLKTFDITSGDSTTYLFASQRDSNRICVIDPAAKTYTVVPVESPYLLTRRPGRKQIWFTADSSYCILDYTSGYSVTRHVFINASTYGADEIRFSADGNTAFLASVLHDMIYKINPNTQMITDSVSVTGLWGVEVKGDGSVFYASSAGGQKIKMYNASTMAVIDSVSTPMIPFYIYLTPDQSELWAVYQNNDSLGVFNATTLAPVTISHISPSPYFVAFFNNAPTGVSSASQEQSLSFYPNPTNGIVHVQNKTGQRVSVSVFNALGQKIRTKQVEQEPATIDLSGEPGGMYFYQVREENKILKTGKIIVE